MRMSDIEFVIQQTRLMAGMLLILTILAHQCSSKPIYDLLTAFDENSHASNSLNIQSESEADKLESAISSYLSMEEAYLRGYMEATLNKLGASRDEEEIRNQESLTNLLRAAERRLAKRISRSGVSGGDVEGAIWSDRGRTRTRKRREGAHTVYLGSGQEAAGAAFDTFTSILEEAAGKRIGKGNRPNSSSNPVTFIG